MDSALRYQYYPDGMLHTVAGGTSMVWDAAGNRISFTSSTDQQHPYTFVYDITAGVPAVVKETAGGTSYYYIREPGGALIARVNASTGATQYYHFDELGSTLFLTDGSGELTDKYTYDAWGNVTSHTGDTEQPYQYVGRFGYYTHYQDSNLHLIQTGFRFYEPEVGRFFRMDPIADGWRLPDLQETLTLQGISDCFEGMEAFGNLIFRKR